MTLYNEDEDIKTKVGSAQPSSSTANLQLWHSYPGIGRKLSTESPLHFILAVTAEGT